ncbi:MAG: DUF6273 domain-containing protein [Lachnospiraceae bacterium]|nr:DUF6273 domain-containing protein [Lachnospiraceae bacterium]
MEKPDDYAGRPVSHRAIYLVMLAAFFFAMLAGIRLFESGNAEAALSEDASVVQVSTKTDAEETSETALSPTDIAETDSDYAMASCINYGDAAEAIAALAEKRKSSRIFPGNIISAGSYAVSALLAASNDEGAGEEKTAAEEKEGEPDTTTQNWYYYIYYVGQSDQYDVTKTDDFSLKYQMEFRTSEDLAAGAVEIRIPAALLTYRDGTDVLPDDIAIPAGSPDDYTWSSKTPMNYCYETAADGTEWLVFWNYREITSGTDMAWQVLYRTLDAMSIVDMTTWALDSYVSVDVDRAGTAYEQTNTGQTLTGTVDTQAKLESVSKTALNVSGKTYTPGLYTEGQVNSYITSWTEEGTAIYEDAFDDYVYAVWTVTVSGSGNQPYTLEILDSPTCDGQNGIIMGYARSTGTFSYADDVTDGEYFIVADSVESSSWKTTFYVVTAYPADDTEIGDTLKNEIDVKLVPADGCDDAQVRSASASWTYGEPLDVDVSKSAAWISGKSYGPGLYTDQQIETYVGTWLVDKDEYLSSDDYAYVLWSVTVSLESARAYMLEILDTPTTGDGAQGTVIGYKGITPLGDGADGYELVSENSTSSPRTVTFYVVTAYGKENITAGMTTVENRIDVRLTNSRGKVATDSATASWIYEDYEWNYAGDSYSSNKTSDNIYAGWLMAFEKGTNSDEFPFTTTLSARCYSYTHITDGASFGVGDYTDGTYCTVTVEDSSLYFYPAGSSAGPSTLLGKDDYYYTSVSVSRSEYSWDVWEDESVSEAEHQDDVDETMYIYAVYALAEDGSSAENESWELVASLSFEDGTSGQSCTFTSAQLARQPYKVKAVYNTVNYHTSCSVSVSVRLRDTSPAVKDALFDKNGEWTGVSTAYLKDVSSVTVAHTDSGGSSASTCYSDSPSADKTFTRLSETNEASKEVLSATNDAVNARIVIRYKMSAMDAYIVPVSSSGYVTTGNTLVSSLKSAGVEFPERFWVVFYDLLPYGVKYDASVSPKATCRDSSVQTEVTNVEITENWGETGRTMVAFYVKYSGAEVSYYSAGLWEESWTVSFTAYYDWKDIDVAAADGNSNIFAFMPYSDAKVGTDEYATDMQALLGTTYADDGTTPGSTYADLQVADLNGDGDTETANVLYGSAGQSVNVALASTDQITKLVRADANVSAAYEETASVAEGEGYTYDITVTTINGLTDLVVFDRLEYGLEDHTEDEDLSGETGSWKGTFVSVDTTGAELAGASPVVWYNKSRNAEIPGENETAEEILTAANGWYTEDEWESMGNTAADVGALAVDLGDFELEMAGSVTFRIHMLAPADGQVSEEITHAFNNAYFYSMSTYTHTDGTVQGSTVRVSLGETYRLSVVKEFSGDVPSDYENTEFEFLLTLEDQALSFSQRIYTLWELDEHDCWQQIPGTFATDYNGYLYLCEGQKAVFDDVTSAEIEEIRISETESAFWESELSYETDESGYTTEVCCTATNTFRTPLYVTKLVTAVPEDVDVSDYEFEVTISVFDTQSGEWEPYADSVYWTVKAARINGTEPKKISEGVSSPEGTVKIHAGEVIAVFLPSEGTQYKVEETDTGADFIVQTGTYSGAAARNGTAVNLNNIYRWKDLNLTKLITDQDASECTQEFTFRILHVLEDGSTEPMAGNAWYLTDAAGNRTVSGTPLDENGEFTAACAGGTVTICGLDAGETYRIEETETGECYEDVTGSVSVTMPVYSTSKTAEYTNKWLMRDLSVSKYVAGDTEGESDGIAFGFALSVDGKAAENCAYRIAENGVTGETVYYTGTGGSFALENGQTAVFRDCGMLGGTFEVYETDDGGFTRVYPSDESPLIGTFEEEGNQVTFVNGDRGCLMVAKTYSSDNSDAANAYVALMKSDGETRESAAVTLIMEVTADGETYTAWPAGAVTVEVIDTLSGEASTATWKTDGITIEPWKFIVISESDLGGASGYRISESSEDQYRIFQDGEGNYLSVIQSYPANGADDTGSVETDPVVTFVNKISDVTPAGSAVYKRMAVGSSEPATGAELVLTVQQYDGSTWAAAEGLAYLTFDEAGLTCDRVLATDSDGTITLTKSENGYPYIVFLEAEVSLNFYDSVMAVEGTYRILEDEEATDTDEWGILVGYGSADCLYEYSLDETEAAAFVNSNRTAELKVEKITDAAGGQSFTFTLSRVLSTDEDGNILANEAGANISYIICDSDTDETVSDGVTDALGRFTLTGGQYAVFELADGAVWTVSEAAEATWTLSDLTAETDETLVGWMADVIAPNTARVRTLAETAYVIEAETTYDEVEAGTALDKDRFLVTAFSSDGTSRILASDEFDLSPETAQDTAGEMEVAVAYEGAEDTVVLAVTAETWNVRYAVAVYGINTDTYLDENGASQTAGLTFGPATGESYVESYLAHVEEETEGVVNSSNFKARTKDEAAADGVTYCIHWLTWSQIVEQCAKDPTVFEDCLTNGCTHSVNLNLNSALQDTNYDYSGMTGDGASVLYYSIRAAWRNWNYSNSSSGGWPASRIRATLNGAEEGVTTENIAGTDVLSAEESLFSCFPSVLQESIVAKAVESNTVRSSKKSTDVVTTYDKLWLFSYREFYNYTSTYNLKYEGTQYARMKNYFTTVTLRRPFDETGSRQRAWTRSMLVTTGSSVYSMGSDGTASNSNPNVTSGGLAPGFCLP